MPIPLTPVDSVSITTLVDNATDVFLPDQGPAHRTPLGAGPRRATATLDRPSFDMLIAEHGFSALVTVRRAGTERRLLFDAGVSPDGVIENMRRLELDPHDIEAVVCSHGHFDHTTGLDGLLRVLGPTNLPVVIHPDFWTRRRLVVRGREPIELPTTSRRALEDAGVALIEDRQPSFLFDGSVLVTGEISRTTGYEAGFPPHQAWRAGRWEPDPLVLDEQALVVDVAGKGLVVLTGCGHAGVVNSVHHARTITGGARLYTIMGGFHLNGPLFEPLIPQVCADLHAQSPSVVVPAHCTGWRAQRALAETFGDAFIPNAVGTRFDL